MIHVALHVSSVALNIYVLSVINQLQSVMIINTVHKVHNNLTDICITGKPGVDNMHLVSSTCHSNQSNQSA